LSNYLNQGASRRTLTIELDSSSDFHLCNAGLGGARAVPQHALQISLSLQHVRNADLETLPFRKIQFQGAEGIGKEEGIDHGTGLVGKSIRLYNIHSPGCECTGDVGKKKWTIGGH